jgi:hypothetical protein
MCIKTSKLRVLIDNDQLFASYKHWRRQSNAENFKRNLNFHYRHHEAEINSQSPCMTLV